MKRTKITLRLDWIHSLDSLTDEQKGQALIALCNYLEDGTLLHTKSDEAYEKLLDILDLVDKEAELRKAKAKERRAKKAPVPGYLPQSAPKDLTQKAAATPLVAWVLANAAFKEFSRFDKPLLAELALQLTDWWRQHPTDEVPTPSMIRAEIGRRFGEIASVIPGYGAVTRDKWLAYMAPFTRSRSKKAA